MRVKIRASCGIRTSCVAIGAASASSRSEKHTQIHTKSTPADGLVPTNRVLPVHIHTNILAIQVPHTTSDELSARDTLVPRGQT